MSAGQRLRQALPLATIRILLQRLAELLHVHVHVLAGAGCKGREFLASWREPVRAMNPSQPGNDPRTNRIGKPPCAAISPCSV
jgi:hypothetical protein